MVGGEGAKERRRLKRLDKGSAINSSIAPEGSDLKVLSNPNRWPRPSKSKISSSNGNHAASNDFTSTTKPTKSQIKKPKHLRRKHKQATEDDMTKAKIEQEILDWENKKRAYVQRIKRIKMEGQTLSPKESFAANRETTEVFDDKINCSTAINPEHDSLDVVDGVSVIQEEKGEASGRQESATVSGVKHARHKNSLTYDDADSDEGSCNSDKPASRRQRGRRRRGRKDTYKKLIEERENCANVDKGLEDQEENGDNDLSARTNNEFSKQTTGSDENKKKRYCVGRKPVTDFTLGKTYTGKVVYVKPFGIFLDIGCHSDAFCHVSRVSDDYVDSAETFFKDGDTVSNVRIIEIDRKRKRITVSLQTEARIEEERASIEARKRRQEIRASKYGKSNGGSLHSDRRQALRRVNDKSVGQGQSMGGIESKGTLDENVEKKVDLSSMTPAEQKRGRKLARRASRREQTKKQ